MMECRMVLCMRLRLRISAKLLAWVLLVLAKIEVSAFAIRVIGLANKGVSDAPVFSNGKLFFSSSVISLPMSLAFLNESCRNATN
ncbi:MAG: hypothetical protein ACK56F_11430, partial [bacterium]